MGGAGHPRGKSNALQSIANPDPKTLTASASAASMTVCGVWVCSAAYSRKIEPVSVCDRVDGIRSVEPWRFALEEVGIDDGGSKLGCLRIPVKVISDSGLNVISESGQSDHRSERSDAGVGL